MDYWETGNLLIIGTGSKDEVKYLFEIDIEDSWHLRVYKRDRSPKEMAELIQSEIGDFFGKCIVKVVE